MASSRELISCRWLNGDETNFPFCKDVAKLRTEVAKYMLVFPFDVIVFDREHSALEADSLPPREVAVLLKEKGQEYTPQMWKDTVIVFAADGCRDGVTRALQMMDGIASSVVDDALSHFVSTNNLAALDTLRLASPLADVTRISDVGFSPLMWAASEGQDEAARWCMKHGADVNAQGCFDLTPLMLCAARGYTNVARALLERGAKIHTAFGSAMQDACIEGHLDMVRLFVEYKADVNEVGSNGLTPLLSTIQLNSLQVAEYLLQCGAKVDARDRDKCTGLVNACELGLEEMVKLFLEYDADVNAANKHGVTALMKALKHGSEPIAKLLLSKNARITRDKRGRTPVSIAKKSRTTFTHGLMKQISRLSS